MMEISTTTYLPELGMEDPTLFEQYPMDCLELGYPVDEGIDYDFQSLVSECGDSYSCYNHEYVINSKRTRSPESVAPPPGAAPPPPPARPTKQLKTAKACASNSSSKLISFEQYNYVKLETSNGCNENLKDFGSLGFQDAYYENTNFVRCDKDMNNYKAATVTRNAVQAQDHVMAERKRREKLNQRFITLSSIIPGLKKMDKASVLEDAIKYLKQLQEREKILEEQVAMKTAESAMLLRRSDLSADDDVSTSDENSDGRSHHPLPEIEARVLGKDLLIRIHCDKHIGYEATILTELKKLHLTVQSSSILPFGKTTLCITIVAQMEKEQCMTAKDFLKSLRKTLGQLVR